MVRVHLQNLIVYSMTNLPIAELPEYAAGAAYRIVELLLGRIPSLGQAGDFTTQTGNYTGTSPIYAY